MRENRSTFPTASDCGACRRSLVGRGTLPPEWDVVLDGVRIGWIEQWNVRSASSTFYRATAVHPGTGAPIPLESNTDLAERVEKVVAAWRDPARFVRKSSWD